MGEQTNGAAASNGIPNGHSTSQAGKSPKAPTQLAVCPNDPEGISAHVEDIRRLAEKSPGSDHDSRLELLGHARRLVQSLETPRETMIRHSWAEPTLYMALTMGVRVGLFEALLEDEGSPKQVDELAPKLGMDPALLRRVTKHIAAMGYLTEVGKDTYMPNNFAKSLTIPTIGRGYPCLTGMGHLAFTKTPEFFAKHGYREPVTVEGGVWKEAHDTSLDFFTFMQENPPIGPDFNLHMGGYRYGRRSWMDDGFFPVRGRLLEGAKKGEDEVLLVDVGGGLGQDIAEFHSKHPSAQGRLILQDTPVVCGEAVDLNPAIERMPHDFFTEQPIKGARAYYQHSVLHDWGNAQADPILAHLKSAMEPGYSRLLINENVIPDTGAHWETTALDLTVMTLLASKERTETQWRELLEERAGFRIVNIWGLEIGNGVESLIECEVP